MLPTYGDLVSVKRPAPAEDKYGDSVPGSPTTLGPFPAHVQPAGSSESREPGRERSVRSYRVWLDGGVDVRATDKLVWKGLELEIDGEPDRWDTDLISYVELRASYGRG
jgi:head-tail adaptor